MLNLFDKPDNGNISTISRVLPALVFLVVAIIGLGMSFSIYRASEVERRAKFESVAGDAADRIVNRFYQHMSLLEATKAFFEATDGNIDRPAFRTYVGGLDTEDRYDGIQGIGFARMIYTGNEGSAEDMIGRANGEHRRIWPETDQDFRAAIVMLEPDNERNRAAIGYDMYSDPVRRDAMAKAFATDTPRASGPVELVQEITENKQPGFLLYLPLKMDRGENDAEGNLPLSGFIYAPFRAGDLYRAVMNTSPALPVAIEAYDKDAPETLLFKSETYDSALARSALSVHDEVDIAGRTWVLEMTPSAAFEKAAFDITPFIVGCVALLLAVALALAAQWQIKALAAAREVQRVTEKSLQERELMLQEMKHRIKNSIARMLAIARQTAHHSESLEQFVESYSARLQAMSTAQDVLTRSRWQRADLKELLNKELEQVFGDGESHYEVYGPTAEIDEKATQAFSLTFHELATNALKYGGMSGDGAGLKVSWSFQGTGAQRKLKLIWEETGAGPVAPPERKGFGTRLIDANIIGELQGTIDRQYGEDGLKIEITFPHPAQRIAPRRSRWHRGRHARSAEKNGE
ncbi:CHASE domain-containing protein [Martelella soudanensis]|uniref:CHASE domain-containing protein n=1 Tax=unclassified Martelella TaxID=2629616 RepID=UPI0015DF5D1F|nr:MULTISPECIES: CHASE domain-containing protein [unclassified Martelella]